MNLFNDLPLYEISIDGSQLGMVAISLVDDPAVEKDFICFNNDKRMKFSTTEEQCITGVAIIADKPIYRRMNGEEFYVVFTKDVIKQIVERYSKENLWNSVDLQHDGNHIDGVILREMYLKDSSKGLSPVGFEDVSDGSLFVTFHVEDPQLWKEITEGDTLNGFSIEIFADIYNANHKDDLDLSVDSLLSDKKKVQFDATSDLTSLMKERGVADLVTPNTTLKNAQVHSIGKQQGKPIAIIYADSPEGRKQWYVQPLESIKSVKPLDVAPVEYNYNLPSWNAIQQITDQLTIEKTEAVMSADMKSIIEDRRWVMINYNDERDGAAVGARQCMVVAWGLSLSGNECIRVFEKFGTSRETSGDNAIPNYRLLLTKRITRLKVIDFMEPWSPEELNSKYNWAGDDGMSIVYEWYH